MADIEMDQSDADPIKATYDVYVKPHISSDREIYIMQFPNRDAKLNYSQANQSQPLKLRIKPTAGMLELDVPIDVWRNYDREKGLKWGEAMKRSNMAKGGGSYGMPGGFGIGGAQPAGRSRGLKEEDEEEEITQERILGDYAGAIQREQVLIKQTLGGQSVPIEEATPQYLIGAFHNDQLHLTPVDHIVQMRPQFHHVDAHSEQEHLGRPRDPSAIQQRMTEARAIHMTVKSSVDGEEDSGDKMAVRISTAQSEPWRGHRYIDEDSAEAWDAFHENLFVTPESGLKESNDELRANVPKLLSGFEDGYMDTISAPRNAARLLRSKKAVENRTRKAKGKKVTVDGAASDDSGTMSGSASDVDMEDDGAAL